MAHSNIDYVTSNEFYTAIEELQTNLIAAMEAMGEGIETKIEEKLTKQNKQMHEETRVHLGAMIEDAEERFLHTSHDQVSLNSDSIDKHEMRIGRLETVAGVT